MNRTSLTYTLAMITFCATTAVAEKQVVPLVSCDGATLEKICHLKDPGGKHEHGSCQLQFTINDKVTVKKIKEKKGLLADFMDMSSYKEGDYVPDVDTARFENDGTLTIPEFRETVLQDPITDKNTLVSRIHSFMIIGAAYYLKFTNHQVNFDIYEVTSGRQELPTPGDSRRESGFDQEVHPKKGGSFTFKQCEILHKISDSDSLAE